MRSAREALAETAEAAGAAAQSFGTSVAIKAVVDDVAHKSDAGLVVGPVAGKSEVERQAAQMLARAADVAGTTAKVHGVLVQEWVGGGLELIVGVRMESGDVPVVTVGLGGVNVELLNDHCSRLAPITLEGAREMLAGLRLYPLLTGYRGGPRYDVDAAAAAVVAMARFGLAAAEWLDEAEVNPLIVLPQGNGAIAVDALVTLNR